ncbi:MAG: DUF2147 domain-containing protein [Pseudomonadales bacterium]
MSVIRPIRPVWLAFVLSLSSGAAADTTAAAAATAADAVTAGEEEGADPREAVYGIWASSGTMIEVTPGADGGLSARIIALKHPNWREKDRAGAVGEPKTDLHNPDERLRTRPLLGLEILSNYTYQRGRWHGRLYLPTSGNTWTSTARVRNGNLLIRGFLGISLLGRTETFAPLAACNEDILRMIESAGMTGTPCDDKLENVN